MVWRPKYNEQSGNNWYIFKTLFQYLIRIVTQILSMKTDIPLLFLR